MTPDLFANSTVPVLEQVVMFSQARHGVLAGNIANLDTPNYKSRDLSPEAFQKTLGEALQATRERSTASPGEGALLGSGLVTTGAPQQQPAKLDYEALSEVRDSIKSILYHDNSDVSLEQQITEITKNQAQHNLAIRLMGLQFRQMQAAISERVS